MTSEHPCCDKSIIDLIASTAVLYTMKMMVGIVTGREEKVVVERGKKSFETQTGGTFQQANVLLRQKTVDKTHYSDNIAANEGTEAL